MLCQKNHFTDIPGKDKNLIIILNIYILNNYITLLIIYDIIR